MNAVKPRKTRKTRPRSRTGGRAPISFRIEKALIDDIDQAAERVGETRNSLVEMVLHEYIVERNDADRIVKEAGDARRAKLFE